MPIFMAVNQLKIFKQQDKVTLAHEPICHLTLQLLLALQK